MSITLMAEVFASETLPPTDRLVLLSLADHAGEDGTCYPSIDRLCRRTGLKERTVQTAIKRLRAAGYLSVEMNAGKRGSNLYTVTPTPAADAPPQEMHPAADAPHPRRKCTPTPAADAPKPSLTIIEPSEEPPVGPPQKKPKRAVALPEGWVPSEKNIADAMKRDFSEKEIEHEADQFRDYHHARGTTFKDWDAAWRTWLGNVRKFQGRGMAGQSKPRGYGQGSSLASVVARRQSRG